MIHRIIASLRHQWIGIIALFIALGGTSYAAINLSRNSVGTRQLRAGAVTPAKLSSRSFGGHILYTAKVAVGGRVISSSPKGATTVDWLSSSNAYSAGTVRWHRAIPKTCFALAGTDDANPGGPTGVPFASAQLQSGTARNAQVFVGMPTAAAVSVAVICPG